MYLSFVTDAHPSFVTDLPMHFDLVGIRMFRQGCHCQARGTTHRTTYETDTTFSNADATPVLISGCIQHPNIGNIRAFINCVSHDLYEVGNTFDCWRGVSTGGHWTP